MGTPFHETRTAVLSAVTRDWSLATIVVARSGFPFNAQYILERPSVAGTIYASGFGGQSAALGLNPQAPLEGKLSIQMRLWFQRPCVREQRA